MVLILSCCCFKLPRWSFSCPVLFVLPFFLLTHVSFLNEVRLMIRFGRLLSSCFQGEQTACWRHCNSAFYCHHSSADLVRSNYSKDELCTNQCDWNNCIYSCAGWNKTGRAPPLETNPVNLPIQVFFCQDTSHFVHTLFGLQVLQLFFQLSDRSQLWFVRKAVGFIGIT